MTLIYTGRSPSRPCEVCGSTDNVCQSSVLGRVCGGCILWCIPILYGART